jgi:opacity protein-like surface antigen
MHKQLALVAALALAGAPAMAQGLDGLYFNPEFNGGFSGSKYVGSSADLHFGYEDGPWYIQAGPALSNDTVDSEWGFSGKGGVSAAVSDNITVYTEGSYAKFKDVDANYGLKLGAKYLF